MTVEPVRRSVSVQVPRDYAFEYFTANFSAWWPLASHHIGSEAAETAIIEPRVGGRWFERAASGAECDWGRVLEWEPPARVLLAWQLNHLWQYDPALHTEVEVRFIAEGEEATRVELEHRLLERMGEHAAAVRAGIDSPQGWQSLLDRFATACAATIASR